MRWTTKWVHRPRGGSVSPLHHTFGAHNNKKFAAMPRRGYRKGISDRKVPRPAVLKIRTSRTTEQAIRQECTARSMTLCALGDAVLTAHTRRTRAELKHMDASKSLIRELARIGNNLNQIAREAHLMRLHLLERDARHTITTLQTLLRDL